MKIFLKFGIGANSSTFKLSHYKTLRFKTGVFKTGDFEMGKLKTGFAENLGLHTEHSLKKNVILQCNRKQLHIVAVSCLEPALTTI